MDMAVYHRLLKREARERERLLAFEAVVKPRVLGALEGAKIARWHLRVRRALLVTIGAAYSNMAKIFFTS